MKPLDETDEGVRLEVALDKKARVEDSWPTGLGKLRREFERIVSGASTATTEADVIGMFWEGLFWYLMCGDEARRGVWNDDLDFYIRRALFSGPGHISGVITSLAAVAWSVAGARAVQSKEAELAYVEGLLAVAGQRVREFLDKHPLGKQGCDAPPAPADE